MKLDELKYFVFPSKRFSNCEYATIHDQTFNFWVETWTKAFTNAAPSHGWPDHFQKQDFATAITYRDQVVAAHLYTVYDITAASTRGSEYFSFITPETQKYLLENNYKNLMSMEYLSVHPEVKRNPLQIGFGKLITSLGVKVAEEKGLDAAIGTPVKGQKSDKMAENVGGFIVQGNFLKYGLNVDFVLMPTQPAHTSQDEAVRKVSDYLWTNRTDYTISYHTKLAA